VGAEDRSKMSIDAAFLAPFVTGVVEVFQMQSGIKVEKQSPFAKPKGFDSEIGIAGVISLDSAQFKGTIAVCFPKQVFLDIYEAMLGESHSELGSEVQDGAAEILNMVYGQAKTVLKQKGFELEKAIPTVMLGDNMRVHFINEGKSIIVPFKTDFGTFHLEIIIQN